MGGVILCFQSFIIPIPHILEAFSLCVVMLLVDKVSAGSLLPSSYSSVPFPNSPRICTSVQHRCSSFLSSLLQLFFVVLYSSFPMLLLPHPVSTVMHSALVNCHMLLELTDMLFLSVGLSLSPLQMQVCLPQSVLQDPLTWNGLVSQTRENGKTA